jgi:type IV secretion system protein TrbL
MDGPATIGGAQADGSTGSTSRKLEETLDKVASHLDKLAQPKKPTLGERLGEANRHLHQEQAETRIAMSAHAHD